jgi:hypothetical protein
VLQGCCSRHTAPHWSSLDQTGLRMPARTSQRAARSSRDADARMAGCPCAKLGLFTSEPCHAPVRIGGGGGGWRRRRRRRSLLVSSATGPSHMCYTFTKVFTREACHGPCTHVFTQVYTCVYTSVHTSVPWPCVCVCARARPHERERKRETHIRMRKVLFITMNLLLLLISTSMICIIVNCFSPLHTRRHDCG